MMASSKMIDTFTSLLSSLVVETSSPITAPLATSTPITLRKYYHDPVIDTSFSFCLVSMAPRSPACLSTCTARILYIVTSSPRTS